MTEAKQPLKVFLCHASADKPAVRDLYRRLAADGVDVWLDAESLIAGQNWKVEIPKAIKESDVVIVCLSEKSVNKEGYVQKEIKFALDVADEKPEGTIFIVPARLEECAVPDRLSTYHWVDLFAEDGYGRLMRALRLRADKIDATLKVKKGWLPPITDPIKRPKNETRSTPLFKFLRERKETVFSAFGILMALLALLFGDNIYEQFTGRSIFATKPVPTLTSTATFTPKPITPSQTLEPTQVDETPTVSITSAKSVTPTSIPTPEEFQIGYFVEQFEGYDLYIIDETGESTKVAEGLKEKDFAVSNNGQYIAESKEGIIYYLDTLTGEEAPLIQSVYQRNYENLTWSHDGKYVFATVQGGFSTGTYYSFYGPSPDYSYTAWTKFYIIDTSSLGLSVISDRVGHPIIANAVWSFDGKNVAFWENGNIKLISIDTGQISQITEGGNISNIPFSWSPDGINIAFVEEGNDSLQLIDVNTKKQTVLIEGLTEIPHHISWSHDGERIFFASSSKIFVYDFSINKASIIADGEMLDLSSEGSKLLFVKNEDIFVANTDGSEEKNIINTVAVFEEQPFWIDVANLFKVANAELETEMYGDGYTLCFWRTYWAPSEAWREFNCSCSGEYCSCTETVGGGFYSEKTYSRSDVDRKTAQNGGSCQYVE